jgi:hypothetical protein
MAVVFPENSVSTLNIMFAFTCTSICSPQAAKRPYCRAAQLSCRGRNEGEPNRSPPQILSPAFTLSPFSVLFGLARSTRYGFKPKRTTQCWRSHPHPQRQRTGRMEALCSCGAWEFPNVARRMNLSA